MKRLLLAALALPLLFVCAQPALAAYTVNDALCVNGTSPNVSAKDCATALAGTSVANPGTGNLERLLPIQTVTGTSKTFAQADLFKKTRRSNSGTAMTDTLPVSTTTGLANGTELHISNVDASASDTVSAGAGTTIASGSTYAIPAGRDIWLTYDLANTDWKLAGNTGSAVIGPSSATSGNVPLFGDTTGKKIGASALTDNGSQVKSSEPIDAQSNAYLNEIANAASTGTSNNHLAKLTGAPSTAVITGTSDTGGMIGIVIAGGGTTGNALVSRNGVAACVFDGATTAGDYVVNSTTTAGDCHDNGSTQSSTNQSVGRVLSTNGGAGSYAVLLSPPDAYAGAGSGNVTGPASSTNTDIAVFSGTTGQLLADGGATISTLAPKASPTFTGTVTLPDGTTSTSSGTTIYTCSTQGDVPYASSTGIVACLAPGTAKQVLQTGGASANPAWASPPAAVIGGSANGSISAGTTDYLTPFHSAGPFSSEPIVPWPIAGTFKNLYCAVTAAPGTGHTVTCTLRINNASPASGPTCQISNSATTCNDTTDTATITAGQPVDLQVAYGASATSSIPDYGCAFYTP